MFKRGLIFISFFFLATVIWVQSDQLLLSFFVLFPALAFPVLFFLEDNYRILFPAAFSASLVLFLIYLARAPSAEMLFLGVGFHLFAAAFILYRRRWSRFQLAETRLCDTALAEVEALKQKHYSRLESLHHLEKQVAGLLDLFEIAREFNDTMSFTGMADILLQKVMPGLPFERLRLTLFDKTQEPLVIGRTFTVAGREVSETAGMGDLTGAEMEAIEKARAGRKMAQSGGEIVFPLAADGELTACLLIEGTEPEDLAKFEVLAAYMTLQVKKVQLYETVRELSIQDGLTGVFVRRHFLERLDEELKRSMKYNLPLAVLMLDIDHFKRYNDDYGHLAGDATLKQVASLLRENLRKVDIVGRYGGEEFVVVIPETRRAGAHEAAERIRSNVARTNFKVYSDQTRVTLSIGIALFPEDVPDWTSRPAQVSEIAQELIRHADEALYRAKDEGRNRVVSYHP